MLGNLIMVLSRGKSTPPSQKVGDTAVMPDYQRGFSLVTVHYHCLFLTWKSRNSGGYLEITESAYVLIFPKQVTIHVIND